MFQLGARSISRLQGVHPDLVKVVHLAIKLTPVDFTVIEGLRSRERQEQLVAAGASKTMKSRHIHGFAVDLAPYVSGEVRWDWPLVIPVAEAMQRASDQLQIPVRWGGTWKLLSATPQITPKVLSRTFPDGPHFELPSARYPDPR